MKKQSFVLLILLMLILCFAITLPASADIQSDIRVYLRRLQVEDTYMGNMSRRMAICLFQMAQT